MTVIDQRTRLDGDLPLLDPDQFFRADFPAAIETNRDCVVPALPFVAPRPMVVEVEDSAFTLTANGDVNVTPGIADDTRAHVRLTRQQLHDVVHDQQTLMSLWAKNALDQPKGNVGHACDWWLVWRAALDGTPMYMPGSITFDDIDLARSFTLDDDVEDMRTFLQTAGFLHIRDVFTRDEMAAISADMDAAAPQYSEGDGRSWWARLDSGESRVVRMQGFDRESSTAHGLLEDNRFLNLAKISGAGHEFGRKRASNRMEALFKPIGVTEGISDIPWHKDCGIGRHSYECCSMTVGMDTAALSSGRARLGDVRESAPLTVLDRHFKS
jgi:hypothetical protein